jgi:hypothetical protein
MWQWWRREYAHNPDEQQEVAHEFSLLVLHMHGAPSRGGSEISAGTRTRASFAACRSAKIHAGTWPGVTAARSCNATPYPHLLERHPLQGRAVRGFARSKSDSKTMVAISAIDAATRCPNVVRASRATAGHGREGRRALSAVTVATTSVAAGREPIAASPLVRSTKRLCFSSCRCWLRTQVFEGFAIVIATHSHQRLRERELRASETAGETKDALRERCSTARLSGCCSRARRLHLPSARSSRSRDPGRPSPGMQRPAPGSRRAFRPRQFPRPMLPPVGTIA